MKINVKIDRISIQVDSGEELWLTLEAAKDLQRDLNNILGPEQKCIFKLGCVPTPI